MIASRKSVEPTEAIDPSEAIDIRGLPESNTIAQGVVDLEENNHSVAALLVAIAAPRLRSAGLVVPEHSITDPEITLYRMLQPEHGDGAYSYYNALIRRLVSFSQALEQRFRRRYESAPLDNT